jgi:drug/metabolite transporter superfamily protein YnfA
MRLLLAPFRWWLKHPWQAFWLTVLAFQIAVFVFLFEDSPLHSPAFGRIFVGVGVLLLGASFLWGIWVSVRRSRGGAITKVALPVLLCLILFSIGVTLPTFMRVRAHEEQANADARAIGLAVTRYATHMGRLPAGLADLTTPATNARGETARPFIERLPTPPVTWTGYRYEARADGTFSITSTGDGRIVTFSEK